jgi:Tetratricopeptide repeat
MPGPGGQRAGRVLLVLPAAQRPGGGHVPPAGLHPGPGISVAAAASLAAAGTSQARRALRELTRAHLISEHVPGRYAFHDLLRAYAAAQARALDSEAERQAATGRVLDHYLHTAAHGYILIDPGCEPITLAAPRPGTAPEQFAGYRQPMTWFEAERQVLLAAACLNLGDYDQALGHFSASLELYRRLGNRLGEAKIHQNLSVLPERQDRCADALAHSEQGLRLHRAIGHKGGEAEALNSVGWCHSHLGDYEQARAPAISVPRPTSGKSVTASPKRSLLRASVRPIARSVTFRGPGGSGGRRLTSSRSSRIPTRTRSGPSWKTLTNPAGVRPGRPGV